MLVNNTVFGNILKTIPPVDSDGSWEYSMQVSTNTDSDNIVFSATYYIDSIFSVFTRIQVDKNEFESIPETFNFILNKEHTEKLITLCRMYPKKNTQISVDYDTVTINLSDNENSNIFYRIITNFEDSETIIEPVLY